MRVSPLARIVFYSHALSNGCWIWIGAKDRDGYGTLTVAGTKRGAHRVSYELIRGDIPPGLVLDHLCRNRACVNPEHLEPVTNDENVNRGLRSNTKSHCTNGHAFTARNTGPRADSGQRRCRRCNADAAARSKARRMQGGAS